MSRKIVDIIVEKIVNKVLAEEVLGQSGGLTYFQVGGSLPDNLYNLDKDGKPTRDPGVATLRNKPGSNKNKKYKAKLNAS